MPTTAKATRGAERRSGPGPGRKLIATSAKSQYAWAPALTPRAYHSPGGSADGSPPGSRVRGLPGAREPYSI